MLAVDDLRKTFGSGEHAVRAVAGVSLDVPEGALFTLLGPSGCGKTTTLRCVAGLETPDSGTITVAGRTFVAPGIVVPPDDRALGMVFQSYAIWPHMSVRDNVGFPLRAAPRRRRPTRSEAEARVERALAVVRLDGLEDRRATDLSGGQQQRLALARALALQPPLLLLDEPLSNLDARLREEVRIELQRIQRDVGVTTLYVTHDQEEALALSTLVGVMHEGRLEQVGTPQAVYGRPASRFVARFVGAANLVEGTVEGRNGRSLVVRTNHGPVSLAPDDRFPPGSSVVVVARPEHVRLDSPDAGAAGGWRGRVVSQSFLGDAIEQLVAVDGIVLRVREPVRAAQVSGAEVAVRFDPEELTLVPDGAGTDV